MSTSTLTDRYVHDVVRRVPTDQRADVAAELRGTIADTIDAQEPPDPEQAERQVLTEMGDPSRLGAQYANRTQVLIGPALYPTYIRLLMVMLGTLLPVFTVAMVAIDVAEGADLATIAGTALWAIVGVGGQIIAWSTIICAVLERAQRGSAEPKDWSVDDLPELPQRDTGGRWAWVSAAAQAIVLALIVWQQVARPVRTDAGEQIAVLDPALWSGWIWPLLVGLLGAVLVQVLRVTVGGWTRRLVVAYLLADLLAAVPLIWIMYQQTVFNPALLAEIKQPWTTPDEIYTGAAVIVAIVAVSANWSRFRQVWAQE